MISSYAPSVRARRIIIAILAFALAAAFAMAASIAPADAGEGDVKEFNVFVGPRLVDGGSHPTGDTVVTVGQGQTGATFTFENPDDDTNTQQAGSFKVVFPSAFDLTGTGAITLSSGDPNGWSATASGHTLDLYANSSGNRLGIDQKISVDVSFDAAELGTFGPSDFTITGDQQAGGVPAGGGNTFFQANASSSPTIIVVCAQGEPCSVTASGNQGDSGTAACPPEGCPKAGTLTIEFQGSEEDCGGATCSLWVADAETGGDDFYLIIDVPDNVKGEKIYANQFNSTGTVQFGIGQAKNCKPPKRNYGCVDTSHPEFVKGDVYPIRFPPTDPGGGWGRR